MEDDDILYQAERDYYLAKAQERGVDFVDLDVFRPEAMALEKLPTELAQQYNVLPFKRNGAVLYVAMTDTNNLEAADAVRLATRCQVRSVLSGPYMLRRAIAKYYPDTTE